MTLAASPALAQMRGSEPAKAPTRVAATSLSAAEMTKPRFEFTLMGGYRFMHGAGMNMGSMGTNTYWNKTDNSANTANPVTTYDFAEADFNIENYTNTLQHGFSVAGSVTYWLDQSFGLGLDYTFAQTGAKLENLYSLGYTAYKLPSVDIKDPTPGDVADGTKTEQKGENSNPTLTFGNAFPYSVGGNPLSVIGVTLTNGFRQQPGATGDNDPKYGFSRVQIANSPASFQAYNAPGALWGIPADTFVTTEKAIPLAAGDTSPTIEYKAEGKVGRSEALSTTMHFADAHTKTVIGSNGRGELHLLAGLTIPMITSRNVTSEVITGADGTGAAKQTTIYVDRATEANNVTQVIAIEGKQEVDQSVTSTMVGPMIGLGGTFKVNDGFRLYGKFGYTPTMTGNTITTTTLTQKSTVITETTPKTGSATKGTVERGGTLVDGSSHTQAIAGNATSFVLGARFSLTDSLGLNVEGISQNVANVGYTGVSLGF